MRRRQKPLFLILDSLPAHKAKVVQNYVKSTGGKLELYFLPGYAPELNRTNGVELYEAHRDAKRSAHPRSMSSGLHRGRLARHPEQSSSHPLLLQSSGCSLYY